MRPFPKGRTATPERVEAVKTLLQAACETLEAPSSPDSLFRRDRLLEHLHILQEDAGGHLTLETLCALAELMKLAPAEVYETASFYHHFSIVQEDQEPPPSLTIRVCDSVTCACLGAEGLLEATRRLFETHQLAARIVPAPCIGMCHAGPAVLLGQRRVGHATPQKLLEAASKAETQPEALPRTTRLSDEDYRTLARFRRGELSDAAVLETLAQAGLRGLGGAGFPTHKKWAMVQAYPGPRFMAVNADEGEPGTFKDYHYLAQEARFFLEGTLIGAHFIKAERVYIYLRDEYPDLYRHLAAEIQLAIDEGLCPRGYLELRRGAGAYICGEESAMLESIEGKKGLPRHKPPFPAEVGLFGRPTLINNVETLYWVARLLGEGPELFTKHGVHGRNGLRTYSVSGRVNKPGVVLAPAGTTARELVEHYCGGMTPGHRFRAYLPGGASGGLLPESLADVPLDFDTLQPYGAFIGSAAIVIFSEQDSIREIVLNLLRFFKHESCGQCTPCRVGTQKAVALLEVPLEVPPRPLAADTPREQPETRRETRRETLEQLANLMADASICGLGQAAGNPILHALGHFPDAL